MSGSKTNAKTADEAKSRLSEEVYESLVQMILGGDLLPGQPVSELELSRRLAVSRTPVHEAIKQLVKDGLIAQAPNRRPVVVSLTAEDIFDVYEMRRILESEAAAKAAARMDRMTLDRLNASLKPFLESSRDAATIARWVEADDAFHDAIAHASGSPRLASDINRYRLLHRVFNRSHTDPTILAQAAREHAQILAAIGDRDASAARQAMQHHLEEWQRFFVQHLR
jgi:DNA-binding GntR family transcriptional regulator